MSTPLKRQHQHLRAHRHALSRPACRPPPSPTLSSTSSSPCRHRMCCRRYRWRMSAMRLTAWAMKVASAGAGDAEARNGPDAEDEHRVQRDVDRHRQQHEVERRLGVPGTAQHRHDEGVHVKERQRQEDHAHVGHRQRQRVRRSAHGDEQRTAQHESRDGHGHRDGGEERGTGADHALGLGQVVGADALADENGRGQCDRRRPRRSAGTSRCWRWRWR